MSIAATRWALAAAVAEVPGVQGHTYRPAVPVLGDAWPVLDGLDRAAGTAFTATWHVRVLLPTNEEQASEWIDEQWPALFEALERVGFVGRAEPILLPVAVAGVGAGELLAFQITLIAEE
jgi:hypothetical protein